MSMTKEATTARGIVCKTFGEMGIEHGKITVRTKPSAYGGYTQYTTVNGWKGDPEMAKRIIDAVKTKAESSKVRITVDLQTN